MTDKVFPSTQSTIDRFKLPGIVQWAGSDDYGWVVPTGTAKLAAAARLAFAQASGGGSLNVTIDTGEGFVGGSWIDRDAQTVVALAANVAGQIVYAGWDRDLQDAAIVGLAAAFAAEDAKMPIWSFTTNGAGVTAVTDLREQVSPYQRVITDVQHGERTGPPAAHDVEDITGASVEGHVHAASSGVSTDTSTSMTDGASATMTIAIGAGKTVALVGIRHPTAAGPGNAGALVFCNATSGESVSITTGQMWDRTIDGKLSEQAAGGPGFSSGNVATAIEDCYISGTNLIVVFRNGPGITRTLYARVAWKALAL